MASEHELDEPCSDSNRPKNIEESSSDLLLSVSKQMKTSLDDNTELLHSLIRGQNYDVGDEPSPKCKCDPIISIPGLSTAAQSAKTNAAQSAQASAIQLAPIPTAQSDDIDAQAIIYEDGTIPTDNLVRTSQEDTLSLFGGKEFDDPDGSVMKGADNTQLLQNIDNSLILTEESGPPVSEHLSKIINGKFNAQMDTVRRKEILTKYNVPSNCTSVAPKINPEIWLKLNPHVKHQDINLYSQQDTLLHVTSALSLATEDLLNARQAKVAPDYQNIITKIIDCIALVGHVNQELSFKRRDMLHPHLTRDFTQACSRNFKPGKFIFGDDLSQVLKDARSTSRLVNTGQVRPRTSSYTSSHTFPKPSFLGQRGRGNWPPKQNQNQFNYKFSKKRFSEN